MSTTEPVITCRSVVLARRQEVDTWDLADAVYDDVRDRLAAEEGSSAADGVNTGLKEAEDAVYAEHERAGTEVSRSYLHDLFVTRRVWPPEERKPAIATFEAHYALRGKEWKTRGAILERLASKTKTGRAGLRQVRVYKSERKPPAHRTFLELVDIRVRSSLKAAANPWHTVQTEDREAIARLLRQMADEVETGAFPK